VAKASEAHTKSKNPIGPCIKDVVHSMWWKGCKQRSTLCLFPIIMKN
jgi:hypothetical protein